MAEFLLLQPVAATGKAAISEVAGLQAPPEMVTQIAGTKPRAEAQSPILKAALVEEILGAGGMGGVKAKRSTKVEVSRPRTHVAIKVLGEAFKEHPRRLFPCNGNRAKHKKNCPPEYSQRTRLRPRRRNRVYDHGIFRRQSRWIN